MEANKQEISFRGNPIPEVYPKQTFQVADSKEVINKVSSMGRTNPVSIEAIHYGDWGISDVKLTTGDIVPIETAIALAENKLLKGYSTGRTMKGGRTLRSKPSTEDDHLGIHELPQF